MLFLWNAAFPFTLALPHDLFLRSDPLVFVTTLAATRSFIVKLLPAVGIMAGTVLLGRFFCSMVCPLGTAIDITGALAGRAKGADGPPGKSGSGLKLVKYLALCFLVFSALMGYSLAAYGSPLAIATRFFGLVLFPIAYLTGEAGLDLLRPVASALHSDLLAYANLPESRYGLQWFTVVLSGGVLALSLKTKRFWCRYLCPAGALMALASLRPALFKRRVSDACTSCGRCTKACPMDAIADDPHRTDFTECIVCRSCVKACPEDAIRFLPGGRAASERSVVFSRHRRSLVLSALAGSGTALAALVGLRGSASVGGADSVVDPPFIRPPGSIPENAFMKACVGCGECMKTCPTNTLQPAGLAAGFSGLYSPALIPRRGPCDTTCNACGQVCPTGAIRPVPLQEKRYAKIGTAYILRHKCLAWESGKACLVCDEVCPYGAVSLQHVSGIEVSVPVVDEQRCNGCGFCEHYCPVAPGAAVVVEPMDTVRLEGGSYREKAREIGLSIEPKSQGYPGPEAAPATPRGKLPPGFTQ